MNKVFRYQIFLAASASIILVFGLALAILSIFILFDQTDILEIVESKLYRNGVYIAAFSGILIILECILSFVGLGFLNRFFIMMGCLFQIIVLILLVIAAILILSFNRVMVDTGISFMEKTLTNSYGRIRLITNAWDEAQTRMRCCAVSDKGWEIYRNSYWSRNLNILYNINSNLSEFSPFFLMVPKSCCYRTIDGQTGWPSSNPLNIKLCQNFPFGPPRFANGAHNSAIYYRGCFNAILSYIRNYSGYIGGLCIFSVFFLVFCIIASIGLLVNETNKKVE